MSYQVLARKWRPRNFTSLVGQEHVVRALNHALTENRLHHAYLFTGTRGVGKTTIARILAKSLNCETGITAHPCGLCSTCHEIDSGRFVDLLEVDAATNTKVDEMRQLLENAVYAPTRGRFKVYVIDEVHMLSNAAFNAMLKTLEEPPEHVKFILATTDPQKIPVTVLSRCLQFNLKQMVPSAISEYLGHLLNAEGIEYEAPALDVIAHAAAGSMRDGLSLLDQAIAHGAGRVETAQVRQMLGAIDAGVVLGLLEAVISRDMSGLMAGIDAIDQESLSFSTTLQEISARLTEIQLFQLVPNYQSQDPSQQARLIALSGLFSPESVQLAYQIVIQGRQELPLAPDERAGFTMTMLRLVAFVPTDVCHSPGSRSAQSGPVSSLPNLPLPARIEISSSNNVIPTILAPTSVPTIVAAQSPSKLAAPLPILPTPTIPTAIDGGVNWRVLLQSLDVSAMAKTLAQHCELRTFDLPVCLLRLTPAQRHLLMKPAQDKLQQALSAHFGCNIDLKIEIADIEVETPAQINEKMSVAKAQAAEQAIHADPFVQEVIETLGGSVVPSSIQAV